MGQNRKRRIIIWISVFIVLLGFFYYENNHLVVTNYIIESEELAEEFEGYKIVQISDFHNTSFGVKNKRLLKKIKNEKPDMLVITGDLVDSNRVNISVAVDFVEEAVKICPVYYVTGNHERSLPETQRKELFEKLEQAGAVLLLDKTTEIRREDASFTLIGLDDSSIYDNTLLKLTEEIEEEQFRLVLAHEPQGIRHYALGGADLVLCGHAHGGQFRIPFIGPVYAPGQGFFPKLTNGEHESGDTKMIISRGLGNSVIPVRLFNDPEIVVVTLKAQ